MQRLRFQGLRGLRFGMWGFGFQGAFKGVGLEGLYMYHAYITPVRTHTYLYIYIQLYERNTSICIYIYTHLWREGRGYIEMYIHAGCRVSEVSGPFLAY